MTKATSNRINICPTVVQNKYQPTDLSLPITLFHDFVDSIFLRFFFSACKSEICVLISAAFLALKTLYSQAQDILFLLKNKCSRKYVL